MTPDITLTRDEQTAVRSSLAKAWAWIAGIVATGIVGGGSAVAIRGTTAVAPAADDGIEHRVTTIEDRLETIEDGVADLIHRHDVSDRRSELARRVAKMSAEYQIELAEYQADRAQGKPTTRPRKPQALVDAELELEKAQ